MINQLIVDILVNRIRSGGVNPVTGVPMTIDDIKIPEYKTAVSEALGGGNDV
ncbi:hypothetical protein M6D81_11660 [Paenibacillus sp. J5C_2022]|uniref:hypothetical protein n=1 Tax=Paenibacillus sp. J5C2022 TaxID=2977129 RepID=UPI0021D0F12C|nr:hypothetical protein [Paenibacillus sp. J5C2022]MCU6709364.1 hypothetical protein [Paenibacillus sp. J5C2022]